MIKIEFETFNDGVVDLYEMDDKRKPSTLLYSNIPYSDKVIGVKRHYSAKSHNVNIDRLIKIPQNKNITTDLIVKDNDTYFSLIQVQHIEHTKPPITQISLEKRRYGA